MENMLKHLTCQSFGTDCKELIAMIKEPHAWPSFAMELERIETLQICFPDFNIIYVPRACNQTSDFLAKTARSFHKELLFIGCSIPVWLSRPPQVWVIEWLFDVKKTFQTKNERSARADHGLVIFLKTKPTNDSQTNQIYTRPIFFFKDGLVLQNIKITKLMITNSMYGCNKFILLVNGFFFCFFCFLFRSGYKQVLNKISKVNLTEKLASPAH